MSYHSAHLVGSNIFIFGGISKGITLNTVFILEPGTYHYFTYIISILIFWLVSKLAYGVSVAGNIVTKPQIKQINDKEEVVVRILPSLLMTIMFILSLNRASILVVFIARL